MPEMTSEAVNEGEQKGIPTPISKKEVDAIRAARELPKSPGSNVSFNEMRRWLKQLETPEQQNRIDIYTYRHAPVINRQQSNPDNPNNIDVIYDGFEQLDEQYMIDRHGGGKYGFIIVDTGADSGSPKKGRPTKDGSYFTAKLDIPMGQYPPKLNYKEVVWEDANNRGFQAWARANGILDMNNQIIEKREGPQVQASNGSTSDTVATLKVLTDFVGKMSEKDQTAIKRQIGGEEATTKAISDIMVEKMRQEDPNKMVTTLSALIGAMQPKTDNSLATIIIPMMKMMEDSSNRQMTMMMEFMKVMREDNSKGDGEEKSSISQLKDLLEVAREIKGGGSSHTERSTTEVVLDTVKELLVPGLNFATQFLASKNGAGISPNPFPQPGVGQNRVDGTPQNLGSLPGQIPNNPPNNLVTMTPQQQLQQSMSQPQPLSTIDPVLVEGISQFSPLIFQNMGTKEGYELPEMVETWYPNGSAMIASIIRHGTPTIIAAMKQVPEFWGQVMRTYGEEHATNWVDDFVNYKQILAELDAAEVKEEEKK